MARQSAQQKKGIQRGYLQWSMVAVMAITIIFGWRYPYLGFTVPIVMCMGMIGGFFSGRYVCGNLCPRGIFWDKVFRLVSMRKPVPAFLSHMGFRWGIFAALMGFMMFRVAQDVTSVAHWGRTFWTMCVVTTAIGMVLGIFFRERAWCTFCPMGTMQHALGGGKRQLRIDAAACVSCSACEKVCPMALPIVTHKDTGQIAEKDCLRCHACVDACPKNAIMRAS